MVQRVGAVSGSGAEGETELNSRDDEQGVAFGPGSHNGVWGEALSCAPQCELWMGRCVLPLRVCWSAAFARSPRLGRCLPYSAV